MTMLHEFISLLMMMLDVCVCVCPCVSVTLIFILMISNSGIACVVRMGVASLMMFSRIQTRAFGLTVLVLSMDLSELNETQNYYFKPLSSVFFPLLLWGKMCSLLVIRSKSSSILIPSSRSSLILLSPSSLVPSSVVV